MKIYFESIGCRLNQSEIEKMATELAGRGCQVVADASQADLVVINTCAVTTAASSDSRQRIRQAINKTEARIIVTGCYATMEPQQMFSDSGRVRFVPNLLKDKIAADLCPVPVHNLTDGGAIAPRVILPGARKRTRAFIKVQEGCDQTCTFCITRLARGRSRSQPIREIHRDIEAATLGGAKEIVLTGTNLGSWGWDFPSPGSLADLVQNTLKTFREIRIRLSSLEPWDIEAALIELIGEPGFCRHLHLPIQSGCDAILERMNRPIPTRKFEQLLDTIRSRVPEIAITTDIMVGFPGENDLHFKTSLGFIQRMGFAGGHVFRYSPRPGTPATDYPERVDSQTSKARSALMREAIQRSTDQYHNQFSGKTARVLWETSEQTDHSKYLLRGLTDHYIKVEAEHQNDLRNTITETLLETWDGKCFRGKVIPQQNGRKEPFADGMSKNILMV